MKRDTKRIVKGMEDKNRREQRSRRMWVIVDYIIRVLFVAVLLWLAYDIFVVERSTSWYGY